jgi:hypothetical protein
MFGGYDTENTGYYHQDFILSNGVNLSGELVAFSSMSIHLRSIGFGVVLYKEGRLFLQSDCGLPGYDAAVISISTIQLP